MKIEEIDILKIKEYKNNPRKNDKAVDFVANSIKNFGMKQPIVIDKDNVIVAGHTRIKALKKLGFNTVPCVRADDLTEEQIKAYRIADNSTAEASEWDRDLLNIEIDGLDFDFKEFGLEFTSDFEKENDNTYTSEVNIPHYDVKGDVVSINDLYDDFKASELCSEIEKSNLSEAEKKFLIEASKRHIVFDYSKIAEYYASSNAEMQRLMEKSALVIIDIDNAIANGYAKLSKKLNNMRDEEDD